MAATFKTQLWDNTTWGWDQATAGSPCEQLCSELRSWIATVNANASQTGKQLVLERDETSSTQADFRGFTLNMPTQNIAGSLYVQFFSSTASNAVVKWGDTFIDDTSQGGYGNISGGSNDPSVSWKTGVTTSGQMQVAYGVVDGEEFFGFSWYLDSSTVYADSFLVFKDQNGEWAFVMQDGTTEQGIAYDTYTSSWRAIIEKGTIYGTTYITTMLYITTTNGVSTGDRFQGVVIPASSDIGASPQDRTPLAYFADGSTGDYFAKLGYYAPYIRYTPV